MFELHKKHRRGKKTFFYMYIIYGWWMSLISIGIVYLVWLMNYGTLRLPVESFLADHKAWYVDISLLTEWFLLLAFSIVFIAYIRARVLYRHYRFTLDEHAFHLRRGLFFVQETTIPYQQISNVHIARPYHFRVFGIAQLDIVSAADKSVERNEMRAKKFLIPIIDTAVARILSRQLMEYAARTRKGLDVIEEDDSEDAEDEYEDEDEDGETKNSDLGEDTSNKSGKGGKEKGGFSTSADRDDEDGAPNVRSA